MSADVVTSDDRPVWWPVAVALSLVGVVFVAGAVWTFREQSRLADATGFTWPWLLPLSLDAFAVAMAAVAWSASLDGRSAVLARLGVAFGLAATAATSGAWASLRSDGDPLTVAIAVGVPVLSLLALEVLLAEVRRQVQRRRGMPRPAPVPVLRPVALLLAPWRAFTTWRAATLAVAAPYLLSTPDDTTTPEPAPVPAADATRPAGTPSRSRSASGSRSGTTRRRPTAAQRVIKAVQATPDATAAQIAARLSVSERTVQRYWPKPAGGDVSDSGPATVDIAGAEPVDLFTGNGGSVVAPVPADAFTRGGGRQ